MRKKKRRILLVVLSLFTTALVATTGGMLSLIQMSAEQSRVPVVASASETSRPEEAALQCLPDDATDILLRGVAEHTSTAGGYAHEMTFYMFELTSQGQWEERAVMDFEGVCGTAYTTAWGQTLSEQVDMDVARSLRLQSYQTVAERIGGIEELRKGIMVSDEYVGGDYVGGVDFGGMNPSGEEFLPMYPPEDIWALHQLGIYPPEDTYTIKEIEPYVPGQLSQW